MSCERCQAERVSGATMCQYCGEVLARPELFASREPAGAGVSGVLATGLLGMVGVAVAVVIVLLIVSGACLIFLL